MVLIYNPESWYHNFFDWTPKPHFYSLSWKHILWSFLWQRLWVIIKLQAISYTSFKTKAKSDEWLWESWPKFSSVINITNHIDKKKQKTKNNNNKKNWRNIAHFLSKTQLYFCFFSDIVEQDFLLRECLLFIAISLKSPRKWLWASFLELNATPFMQKHKDKIFKDDSLTSECKFLFSSYDI